MKDLMKKMQGMKDMEDSRPSDLEAKMEVLKELHEMATSLLSEDLDEMPDLDDDDKEDMLEDAVMPMQKVTVAAANKEGLEKGLEKAKDVLNKSKKMF